MENLPSIKDQFTISGYKFSESEFLVIKANNSQSVKTIENEKVSDLVTIAIIKAIRTAGQKNLPDTDIQFIANGVHTFAKRAKNTIRIEEILLAIDLGSSGEFTEKEDAVIFVSVKNCIGWVKSYLKAKQKTILLLKTVQEKERLLIARKEREEKESEYWETFNDKVQKEFKYYKENNELSSGAWLIVRGLEKEGRAEFLNIPDEEKKELFKAEEKKEIGVEKEKISKNVVFFSEKMIKNDSLKNRIIESCKNELLKRWFEENKEKEKI